LPLWTVEAEHAIGDFVDSPVSDEVAVYADDCAVSPEVHVGHVQPIQFAVLAESHSAD